MSLINGLEQLHVDIVLRQQETIAYQPVIGHFFSGMEHRLLFAGGQIPNRHGVSDQSVLIGTPYGEGLIGPEIERSAAPNVIVRHHFLAVFGGLDDGVNGHIAEVIL